MQKLGYAQLSYYIPAMSMVYRPFGGYPSLFKSQYIIFFNAFCANCAGPEQCLTMFRPRQWFIDPLVVIHPYLSRNTLLCFNAFCATFATPHTVGCYACLFVSIASLMSSIWHGILGGWVFLSYVFVIPHTCVYRTASGKVNPKP